MKSRNNSILEIVGLGGDNTARRLWKKLKGYHRRSLAETGMYILLPLESYENFCFSIFTYGRGFPRPFCSFPSTMCLHMACFNKQKIEALKLKFSITFKRQQYILLPLESYENFCFSIFTYGRGFPRPFCSFPSTMCLHMACFNKQKIEALKLKFS